MKHCARLRFAIQYGLAALIAFAGSAVLLRLGTGNPLGPAGRNTGLGLLSCVVAALLILTGGLLAFMAATELVNVNARGNTA